MQVAKVRLERHTPAKISPGWSRLATHESNCRTREREKTSQSGVENLSVRIIGNSTQNTCDYTGMRNFKTTMAQN